MDRVVCSEVMRVVQPAAVAGTQVEQVRDDVVTALVRQLEAARYAAHRVAWQFDAADLENRLVTAELVRRWEQALAQMRQLEQCLAQCLAEPTRQLVPTVAHLASDLEAFWAAPAHPGLRTATFTMINIGDRPRRPGRTRLEPGVHLFSAFR